MVNGLGLLTPASPAEGIAFEFHELGRRGLSRRRIALTIGFEQWFSTRVFYLVHAVNLLLIVATRDFPADAAWPIAAAVVILSLLVPHRARSRSAPGRRARRRGPWCAPLLAAAGPGGRSADQSAPGSTPRRWRWWGRHAGGPA